MELCVRHVEIRTLLRKERAEIEALFQNAGARWSQALFGDYENSERFAEDLLSTIPYSADLDRNGPRSIRPEGETMRFNIG